MGRPWRSAVLDWRVLAISVSCSRGAPPVPMEDSTYIYAFTVIPTGNTGPMLESGVEVDYEFRADGECLGRGVAGSAFTPHKGPKPAVPALAGGSLMLAPSDHIAVGVRVASGGRELLRGCAAAVLSGTKATTVEVELK